LTTAGRLRDHIVTVTDDALEAVFRALADPTRRRILDMLADRPGMTTSQLGSHVPGITRWGVIKHLEVLRSAGLIQTLAEGRRRRHYREAAALDPLRRWLSEQ
jgi:predicted transcriptional regulator